MNGLNTWPNLSTVGTLLCLLQMVSIPHANAQTTVPSAAVKSPLSPEESLKYFQLERGLKIELVAAEPQVIDPVSIAFDENGVLWAVEMTDYPNGPQPGQPPMSRISALRDKDGDGRYETSQVFVDKLLFATGIQPWKGGVIVTMAGEVAWFKDSDGDGVADVRQTWFRGFSETNPQLRANHPRWNWDNRIYIANGLRGGVVKADPKAWGRDLPPIQINGFDFRFNPLTGEGEAISGMGQFGLTFDDYGNRFVCSNRNPCRHVVLEDHYLKRNPFLAVKDVGQDVVPSGADSHIYPISRAWTTSTQHAGQFTAACGVTIYRGTALPKEFYGNAFTCDPTGNLVHREVLRPKGVSFEAVPRESTVEFLASPDEWFRPVDLANGPDGALYVVDMYRAVIEHPEWVPDELKHRPDERDGSDRGRIYRIVAADAKGRPDSFTFARDLTTKQLIEKLASSDCWQAETAGRTLVEQQHPETKSLLLEATKSGAELAQWRAYSLLPNFGAGVDELKTALDAKSWRVRQCGAGLMEPFLKVRRESVDKILRLAAEGDPAARFQAALSLSSVPEISMLTRHLVTGLRHPGSDEWNRHAVLVAIGKFPLSFFEQWVEDVGKLAHLSANDEANLQELATLLGALDDQTMAARALPMIMSLPDKRARCTGFLSLCRGMQSRGKSARTVIAELARNKVQLAVEIERFFADMKAEVLNVTNDLSRRLECLSVLEFAGIDAAGPSFFNPLLTGLEPEIDVKALDILATYDDPAIGQGLLDEFDHKSASVRRATIRLLLRNPQRIRLLLDAISKKEVSLVDLDPAQVKALMTHSDAAIRRQAEEVLAAAVPQERKLVLEQYQRALKLEAHPDRGRIVFEKNCATCHQIGKLGVVVGPDIADSRTKTPAQLLVDILSPNQAIDNNYVSYSVVMKVGRVETGFIANETAASITLKQPENKTLQILRTDIDELKSNGISLMPEGLEKNITVEQMADLISFVKNWRYLDGQVPIKVSN